MVAVEEEEPNEYIVDLEEGYVTLDRLPWSLSLKLGRFLPAIGNVNRLHGHDLPWTQAPLPLQDIVQGEEGFRANGARLSWLAPSMGPLTLTLHGWVLNGENEVVLAGEDSDEPSYLGRVEAFLDIAANSFVTLGSNFFFGYNDEDGAKESQLTTVDLLWRHQPNQWNSIVAFGELYYLDKEIEGGKEYAFGAFAALQVQPGLGSLWAPLQQTYLGVRVDYSDYDEQVEDSEQWAFAAYASYYTTEFLRFRIGWEHRERATTKFGLPDEDTLFFQLTFVFGSHPVEPFWFNR